MSFSGQVKEELYRHLDNARHCRIAETAAIISICGSTVLEEEGRYSLKIHTENPAVARKCFTLLEKTFNIRADIAIRTNQAKGSAAYFLTVMDQEEAARILQAVKLQGMGTADEPYLVNGLVIRETC